MISVLAMAAALAAAEGLTAPSHPMTSRTAQAQPDPAIVKQVEELLRGQGYSEAGIRAIMSHHLTGERAEQVRVEQLEQVRRQLGEAAAAEHPDAQKIGMLLNRMTELGTAIQRDRTSLNVEILRLLGPADVKIFLRSLGLAQPVHRPGDRPLIAPPAPPAPPSPHH